MPIHTRECLQHLSNGGSCACGGSARFVTEALTPPEPLHFSRRDVRKLLEVTVDLAEEIDQTERFVRFMSPDPVPPNTRIRPEDAARGRGEASNKGALDIARVLSYGPGGRPDSGGLARDVGLSVDEVDGISPGAHVSANDLTRFHLYSDADRHHIVPRLTGEGRDRWYDRARTAIREHIRRASAREMTERGGKSGLDPKGQRRAAEVARTR